MKLAGGLADGRLALARQAEEHGFVLWWTGYLGVADLGQVLLALNATSLCCLRRMAKTVFGVHCPPCLVATPSLTMLRAMVPRVRPLARRSKMRAMAACSALLGGQRDAVLRQVIAKGYRE